MGGASKKNVIKVQSQSLSAKVLPPGLLTVAILLGCFILISSFSPPSLLPGDNFFFKKNK